MKRLTIPVLLLLFNIVSQTAHAQNEQSEPNALYIYKTDGSKEVILLNNLERLNFSTTEMQIVPKSGNTTTIEIVDISVIMPAEKIQVNIMKKIQANEDLKIYPNPTSSTINIESAESLSSITLFDGQGKKVLQKRNINSTQTIIDISSLSNGAYIMQVRMTKETITKKIIKK
ncbi:MAG: T9SS type A sorting domain-containing protein [Bacteroidales bacterium]|jgi:hypothetical protein|nr:T9SS type A sorting domain-containing protein [Bacteroidales bacterium]